MLNKVATKQIKDDIRRGQGPYDGYQSFEEQENDVLKNKINKIVDHLESVAEGENYHSMIHIYGDLVKILLRHSNHDITLKVMKDIKKRNGFID